MGSRVGLMSTCPDVLRTAETPTEIRARRALRFQYTEIKAFIGACFGQLKPASFTNKPNQESTKRHSGM